MSLDGVFYGAHPSGGVGDHTSDVIIDCMKHEDLGQRKLCALFHSIAIPFATIVYIGSAPGDGWLGAVDAYPNIRRIISVDPRDLSRSDVAKVEHHKMRVEKVSDISELLEGEDNCILVWDVRGDCDSLESDRDSMILREISVLNTLLNDENLLKRFFLLHLKINLKHFISYHLPSGGDFYVQPYSVSRNVYEARYVLHLRSSITLSFANPSETARVKLLEEINNVRDSLKDGLLSEISLICNMLTSRYRRVDYILEKAYNASEEEVLLYTVNHDPASKVLEYLRNLTREKKRYVVSYFTGKALGNDPHDFPEGEALSENLGTILDSRSMIGAKLKGIYFLISDSMNDLFKEEEFPSETYRIRKTEYSVVTRSRIPTYDPVRNEACVSIGAKFPKFPMDFSISDRLLSPSGHALRMTLEYLDGKASMAMFVEKILANFRQMSLSYVKKEFALKQTKTSESSFRSLLRHGGFGKKRFRKIK